MHHICDSLCIGMSLNSCFDQIVLQSCQLNSTIQWVLISPLSNNAQCIIMRYQGAIIMRYQRGLCSYNALSR